MARARGQASLKASEALDQLVRNLYHRMYVHEAWRHSSSVGSTIVLLVRVICFAGRADLGNTPETGTRARRWDT